MTNGLERLVSSIPRTSGVDGGPLLRELVPGLSQYLLRILLFIVVGTTRLKRLNIGQRDHGVLQIALAKIGTSAHVIRLPRLVSPTDRLFFDGKKPGSITSDAR
jgi:hypothetical protein